LPTTKTNNKMNTAKNKKASKASTKVESLQQFKELYFPVMTSVEKLRGSRNEEKYGDVIAMSILDGIKRDLTLQK